jgi:2-aminoadipate transaminase
MSLEKRKELYSVALENRIIIIEDNPYGELSFDGTKLPTIKSLDTEGIVIYCGSFSKILAPGIRIGFTVAHKDLIAKIVVGKQISDVHTPMLTQLMTYRFLKEYDIDEYIVKARELYSHKCKVMTDAIDEYFPKSVTRTSPRGGLFVWCDLNGDYDTLEISKICLKRNVVFVPGSTFMVDMSKKCSAFRLNYSTMPDEKIVKGVKLLGEVLGEIVK